MLAAVTSSGSEIVLWTEEKKRDFVKLFKARAKVSQYILLATARAIASCAVEKKFINAFKANAALGAVVHGCRRQRSSVQA